MVPIGVRFPLRAPTLFELCTRLAMKHGMGTSRTSQSL